MILRRWIAPLLCLAGSSQLQALDCVSAQKTILSLSEANQAQLAVENISYEDTKSFVESKPQISGKSITTGSYLDGSKAYEGLWCKLKSQEAVKAEARLDSEGPAKDCALLNRQQSQEALVSLGIEADKLDGLGIQFAADKDFITGSQWSPSSVLVSKKGGIVSVQAMRLKSATWVPVIGGMNYCKILSPAGALKLVQQQLAAKATAREISTQKIEWKGGLASTQSALLWLHGDAATAVESAKATFIISPGAEIPPEAMSGLADHITELGYLVLLVQYPNNSAILDSFNGHGNSAVNLAKAIKTKPQDISGIVAKSLQSKPVYVLGHSLGGATLGDEIFHKNTASTFDHIFLYGTASFVKIGDKIPTSSPVTLLFGENDGVSAKDIPTVLKTFDITYVPDVFTPVPSKTYTNVLYQRLKGLNHFCIITDQSVGNASVKKNDGVGLDPEACVPALVEALGL